jgi:hypothetical protein
MFSKCIFCRYDLGRNEVIEAFPVGRRLAFDEARGRLWVVCQRCARWNLSPLEERWEAIEAGERAFRDARRRVSSENVGLAVLQSGLELVRIGAPQRPELAAWRYGGNFLKRRRMHRIQHALNGGVMIGAGMLPVLWPVWIPAVAISAFRERRVIAHVPDGRAGVLKVQRHHARKLALAPSAAPGGFTLTVPHAGGGLIELGGDEAVQLAGRLLPLVNEAGAGDRQVEIAVAAIERAGTGETFFRETAKLFSYEGVFRTESRVIKARVELRLALEMAAHEEAERRALEGELEALEAAWREADTIAAIADDLLIPAKVRALLDEIRERGATPPRR